MSLSLAHGECWVMTVGHGSHNHLQWHRGQEGIFQEKDPEKGMSKAGLPKGWEVHF